MDCHARENGSICTENGANKGGGVMDLMVEGGGRGRKKWRQKRGEMEQ